MNFLSKSFFRASNFLGFLRSQGFNTIVKGADFRNCETLSNMTDLEWVPSCELSTKYVTRCDNNEEAEKLCRFLNENIYGADVVDRGFTQDWLTGTSTGTITLVSIKDEYFEKTPLAETFKPEKLREAVLALRQATDEKKRNTLAGYNR